MSRKKYYFVDSASGKVSGPNSLEELKVFQFENRISEETQVTEEGQENWMPFKEIIKFSEEITEPEATQSSVDVSSSKIIETKSAEDHSILKLKPVDKAEDEEGDEEGDELRNELDDQKQGVAKKLFENVVSIKGQLWIMTIVLAAGFGFPAFLHLVPRPKWEYQTIKIRSSAITERSSGYFTQSEITEETNEMGSKGWELVNTFVNIETSFANLGADKQYVTGIRANTRTKEVWLIFKRRKTG